MKRFHKILAYCPDQSQTERVLNWCNVIAWRSEPELISLVRVQEKFLPEFPSEITEDEFLESERADLAAEADRAIPDVPKEVSILMGDPLKNLLSELSSGDYDLLVLPIGDAQSRIFAERLARKSPIGVLLIPPGVDPHFQHILMAVDFSNMSQLTLEWTQAFASLAKRDPILEALHVMHTPVESRATRAIPVESLRNTIHDTVHGNLKTFIDENATTPDAWNLIVKEHPLPGIEIVREADQLEADLIVIGAYGRNALSIALLGGAATEAIRSSDRPILVVKRKNKSLAFLRELLGLSN
ncbi:universal stress protein [Sulfuriroseicoccus oceanibius]|uniref:Universal stress protein n=1 Tax=Sulfuriroseicoccus oceanibius TaxID=2707525 RepID=A0A6B3L3C1_9BACT|nr:universal stress protein [Sulfuriroseicoccus oceanibius]QQL45575.1 universal stress protein [Sulfuriroseicoccus oceanibius]